jgi:hypothetical protein
MKDVVRFYIVCYWLTNLGVRVTGDQCYGVAYGDRNRSGEALANPSPFSQKHLDSLSLSVTLTLPISVAICGKSLVYLYAIYRICSRYDTSRLSEARRRMTSPIVNVDD